MNYLGIDYSVKNMPALDPGFIPFGIWAKAYLQEADRRSRSLSNAITARSPSMRRACAAKLSLPRT